MAGKDDRYLHVRRKTAVKGEKDSSELPFDIMQGNVNISELQTYDEADAYFSGDLAADDANKAEGTMLENTGARGKLTTEEKRMASETPSKADLLRAQVAAKIASLLLPNANATAVENQAAIFARRFSTAELKQTLERCWFDRTGGKIAAQEVAKRQAAAKKEASELVKAARIAQDLDVATETEDDEEENHAEATPYEREEQVPADVASESEVAGMGEMMGAEEYEEPVEEYTEEDEKTEEYEEPVEDEVPPEAETEAAYSAEAQTRLQAGRKMQAKPIKRTASQKKQSPKIANPRRRKTASAEDRERGNLTQIYAQKLGVPTDDEMARLRDTFSI